MTWIWVRHPCLPQIGMLLLVGCIWTRVVTRLVAYSVCHYHQYTFIPLAPKCIPAKSTHFICTVIIYSSGCMTVNSEEVPPWLIRLIMGMCWRSCVKCTRGVEVTGHHEIILRFLFGCPRPICLSHSHNRYVPLTHSINLW